jgi:hypothetical protein
MRLPDICNHQSTTNMTAWLLVREKLLVAFLVLLSFLTAFPAVMTTLAPYDDQGYVMMTLKTFLQGESLYSETHTQYGPAYYLLTGSLHDVMCIPLTQDGVRLKTIALWCVATLLVYSILRRLETLPAVAFFFSGLFHLHLYKLALEPGHPQEWILVLSLLSFWLVVGNNRAKWFLAATLVGMIGMIKINCGLIFAIPLIVQSLLSTKSIASRTTDVIMVIAGGACSAVAICGITMAIGVPIEKIFWGLIGQHRGFANEFFHFVPMSTLSVAYTVLCMWAIYKTRNSNRSSGSHVLSHQYDWAKWRFGLTLAAVVVGTIHVVLDWSTPLVHGLEPRGAANWLILVGPVTSLWLLTMESPTRPYRHYIVLATFLAPFMAYPTPGTQVSLGTAPGWIVLGLITSAGIQSLITKLQAAREAVLSPTMCTAWTRQAALLPAAVVLCLVSGSAAWYRWFSFSSLELRGSRLLRLDPMIREREFKIVQAIKRTGCKHLVFDGHNHNRFFFWTETEPLTAANPTFWPRMLTADEQIRVISSLQANGKVCMVIPPESDQLASVRTRSVRQAFYKSWQEIDQIDNWKIGVTNSP